MRKINKKGNIFFEGTTLIIVLAIFTIFSLVSLVVLKEFNSKWQTQDAIGADSKNAMSSITTKAPSILDGGFAIILGGLWIAAIVSAMYINTNPVFFFTTAFLLAVLVFVVYIVGLSIDSIGSSSQFSAAYATMPIAKWVFSHAWQTVLMMAVTVSIALFGKRQASQYEQY